MKADVVCAPRQAALLAEIEGELSEDEAAVVRRARNADVGGKSRGKTDVRTHRNATGLEALIAYWLVSPSRAARYGELLGARIDDAISEAVARRATKPRRG